jgi:hypothetical protein
MTPQRGGVVPQPGLYRIRSADVKRLQVRRQVSVPFRDRCRPVPGQRTVPFRDNGHYATNRAGDR